MRVVRLIGALCLLILLSACGNEGAQGGKAAESSLPASIKSVSVDSINLTVGAYGSVSQSFNVEFEGNSVSAGTPEGTIPPLWMNVGQSNVFSGRATFTVTLSGLQARPSDNTYTTILRITAGRSDSVDPDRASTVAYKDIPVTVTVFPNIGTNPAAAILTARFGTSATAETSPDVKATTTVTVKNVSGGAWTATSNDSWLTVSPNSGPATSTDVVVGGLTASKPLGNTPGSITFRETLTGATYTLPVTLRMVARDLVLSTSSATTTVTNVASPTQAVTVSDDSGTTGNAAGAASWKVSTNQPWLKASTGTVTAISSFPASTVTFSVDRTEALKLAVGGTYVGVATFTYTRADTTTGTKTFTWTLTKGALTSSLRAISSNLGVVGQSGQTSEVVLLGTGLTGLAASQIAFVNIATNASVVAGTTTVVNDSEVRVNPPSLAAANYKVVVAPGLFPDLAPVNYQVIAAQTFGTVGTTVATLTLTNSERSRAIYDPRALTLYVQGNSVGTLDVFKANVSNTTTTSAAWAKSVTTPALASPITDIALTLPLDSPAGTAATTTTVAVVGTRSTPRLVAINASNYYQLNTATNALEAKGAQSTSVTRIVSLLDGTIFGRGATTNASYLYDPIVGTQSTRTTTGVAITTPAVTASLDGRTVLIGNTNAVALYSPITGAVTAVAAAISQTPAAPTLSRAGDRFVLDSNRGFYYRSTGVVAGAYTANSTFANTPVDAGNTLSPNMQISPDGVTVYAVEMTAAGQPVRVRTYTPTTTATTTTWVPTTTSFTLPSNMNGSVTTKPPVMTISPDGNTLFVLGGALGAVVRVK